MAFDQLLHPRDRQAVLRGDPVRLEVCVPRVFPHCPKSLLRGAAWQPEQWLPADAQPTSAEVTPAQLRMPELTIADTERAEAESLKYRYG